MTPPSVSMPSDSGVTSSSSTSLTSPDSTPPWIAAPMATASSGLTSLRGSRPKKFLTASWTLGIRVWPPTRMTSSISLTFRPASAMAILQGSMVRAISSSTSDSSFARVSLMFRCFGTAGIRRDIGQIDLGLLLRGKLDLGLFGCLLEALHGQRILADVDAALLLELTRQVTDDARIEVLAAEERVAIRGEHFELVLAVDFGDLDDRDVERAATEVVDGDLAIAPLLVEAVGERCRGRLVDDALDLQAGDAAGILGGLPL